MRIDRSGDRITVHVTTEELHELEGMGLARLNILDAYAPYLVCHAGRMVTKALRDLRLEFQRHATIVAGVVIELQRLDDRGAKLEFGETVNGGNFE